MLGARKDLHSPHQEGLQVNSFKKRIPRFSNLTRSARGKRAGRSNTISSDEDHSAPDVGCAVQHTDQAEIVAASIAQPGPMAVLVFVGEGGYGDILDTTGNVAHRHFMIPGQVEKPLAPEDLAYLKVKGCFSLPTESRELIEAYFQFVHPLFPVLDGPSFLQEYARSGLTKTNLLLIWSMFSISASYIPSHSRRATKEVCVQRAKLLFDLTHQRDKIVLVQSTLLLSFWFADAEDIKQSWYWSGIAFGIAQTLGLHRDLEVGLSQSSTRERSLWRDMWRCCLIRDVWLSCGMGRPLRINTANCRGPEVPVSEYQFQHIVLDGADLYTPTEITGFI